VSHTAIQKRAKAEGWARDLSAKVRAKAQAALVTTPEVTSPVTTERQVVERAAETIIQLVREHRKEIKSARTLAQTLMQQLGDAAGCRDELEALIELDTEPREGASPATVRSEMTRRAAMLKAIAMPGHAGVLKDLATVLKSVIPLERQAFSVDETPETVGSAATAQFEALVAKIKGDAARG